MRFPCNPTPKHLPNTVLYVRLDGIGKLEQNRLLQNYLNPFNLETWIPYQVSQSSQNRYPSMTQTGCWFGRFPSEFNLQVSTIAADVPPVGMAETAPVN